VLEALDEFRLAEPPTRQPLRLPIQDIYRLTRAASWPGASNPAPSTSATGCSLRRATKPALSRPSSAGMPRRPAGRGGESIGITLTEQIFARRGEVAALETDAPYELSRFKARLFWLGRAPFSSGKNYKLKLATQEVECSIESIERVIDSSTLETISRTETFVGRNEVAELTFAHQTTLAFDVHADIIATGRFVIVDGFEVAGGGIVRAGQLSQAHRRQPPEKS